MISFSYPGQSNHNLKTILRKGKLEDRLTPILQKAGFAGNFAITPRQTTKGSAHSQGVLRFSTHNAHGVNCTFHPERESSGGNVEFFLSRPTGTDPSVYLDKLRKAQKEVEELAAKPIQKKVIVDMTTPQMNGSATANGTSAAVVTAYTSVYDCQDTLSLVIQSLRKKAAELGAEFLTQKTARAAVKEAASYEESTAQKVLDELCEGEILKKKGNGPATSYAVVPDEQKRGVDASINNFIDLIENNKKALEKIRNIQSEAVNLSGQIKEKQDLLERAKARIPVLTEEISELQAVLEPLERILNSPETRQAIEIGRCLEGRSK